MSFIAPIMFALLALTLPVFVAFLSRKKVEQKSVPSLVIFKHIKAAEPRSRSFATPRNLLALLLYLLAIIALAIAVAQPSFEGEEPRDVIIVLDASYSMGVKTAPQGDETAFDVAKRRIKDDLLANLGPRDRATLIVGDVARRVHVEPTRDLERHIDALVPLKVSGLHRHVMQSLELAQALCDGQKNGTIVLVTDGMVPDGVAGFPEMSCPLTIMDVLEPGATTPANIALTRLAVRQIDALGNTEVYVEAYNPMAVDREVVVELELDEIVVEVLAIQVPAGRSAGQLTRVDGSMGSRLIARAVHQDGQADAISVDDQIYAVLNPVAWVNVLLVSDRKFSFMERAFSLHPRVRMDVVSVAEAASQMQDRDFVIFEEGASQALLTATPARAKVFVLGAQPGAGVTFGAEVERPVVTWWDFDDELFRYVDLDEVEVLTASPIQPVQGDEVLMRAGQDQTLLVRRQLGGRDALVMAFHPDQSDLVLRVAFANLVANLVEWCAASIEPPPAHVVAPGDTLLDAPGAKTLTLISTPDSTLTIPANAPVGQTGIWRIVGGESEGQIVVVNQEGYSESQLQPSPKTYATYPGWDEDEFSSGDRGAKLIRVLLLAALALMVVEALVMWWKSRAAARRVASGLLSTRVQDNEEVRR